MRRLHAPRTIPQAPLATTPNAAALLIADLIALRTDLVCRLSALQLAAVDGEANHA